MFIKNKQQQQNRKSAKQQFETLHKRDKLDMFNISSTNAYKITQYEIISYIILILNIVSILYLTI